MTFRILQGALVFAVFAVLCDGYRAGRVYGQKLAVVEDCPLCDSSVYGYCSNKMLHDACCCLDPYENTLPYQCQFADCSFLHANSCPEHHLITRCCCNSRILVQK